MTKLEYITELRKQIARLPEKDQAEILADYEEHFAAGRAHGKTDEQISLSLGAPRSVAQSILMNSLVTEAETTKGVVDRAAYMMRILLMTLVLAPFNFFMLVGPFLVMFVFVVVGWALPLAFIAATLGLAAAMVGMGLSGLGLWSALSLASSAVGTLGASVLAVMIMLLLTRLSLSVLFSYLKWNVNFITARTA